MTERLAALFQHLAAFSYIWILITLIAYRVALFIYFRTKSNSFFHPVSVTVAIMVSILTVTGTPYKAYFSGTQCIHLLLGPATVALAIPLYRQAKFIKSYWVPLLLAATLGSIICFSSAIAIAWAMGASDTTLIALGSKSVTMPIAIGITEKLNGSQSLTSSLVLLTGIVGTIFTQPILNILHLSSTISQGFALGVSAHGIGVSKAIGIGESQGAYASLAMGLSGVITAILLPITYHFLI